MISDSHTHAHTYTGSYFATKFAATNFVLCNTKAMFPFRTVHLAGDESEEETKGKGHPGLVYLSDQMWGAGCPAVLVFNFEYMDKEPKGWPQADQPQAAEAERYFVRYHHHA